MANNKKKKTNKKTTTKKVVKKQSVKSAKPSVQKEENPSKIFKDFTLLVIALIGVFAVIYGLTVGAHKLGWFDTRYTKGEVEEAEINYDKINAGTMFNREEENYYVLIGDFSENQMYISEIVSEYKEKEGSKKVYLVDISEGMNSYLKGDESLLTSSYPSMIKVTDLTLIEVRNNNNVLNVEGLDNIISILK